MNEQENQEPSLKALDFVFSRVLTTKYGLVTEYLFRYQNRDVIAMVFGNDISDTMVRIHSTCFTAHYMASKECDCREQLDIALTSMAHAGSGVVIFLEQDGRGNGHAGLMRSAVLSAKTSLTVGEAYVQLGYPADARDFRPVGPVLQFLGVRHVSLFTNNPDKIRSVVDAGITVTPIETTVSLAEGPWLTEYYRRKSREGHSITLP